jgi:hypothetical protein
MNTPAGSNPSQPPFPNPIPAATPQTPPTAFGLLQSLATGWLTFKAGTWAGLSPGESMIVASGIVSAATSGIHKLAQKWHLEDVSK